MLLKWAVYGGALVAFFAVFFIVKFCLEEFLPLILGALVGSACLPGIVFVVVGVMMEDYTSAAMYTAASFPIGYIIGCCLGKKLAKFLQGFGTSLIGSLFTCIGVVLMKVEILPFPGVNEFINDLGSTIYVLSFVSVALIVGGTIFQTMNYDDKALAYICSKSKKNDDNVDPYDKQNSPNPSAQVIVVQQPYSINQQPIKYANQVDMEGGSALKSFFMAARDDDLKRVV